VIGVTGTIGSGKTTVCSFFREFGATVIDADALGKEVVEKDDGVFNALVTAFGREILNEDGTLNRRRLGSLAFTKPEKRKELNAIAHPALLKRLREEVDAARRAGPVVVDAALILEWGIQSELDALIVVTADHHTQRERVVSQRGWSPEEVDARMQTQIPPEEQVGSADYVIVNDGTIEDLRGRVFAVWESLIKRGNKL
jgi:dephospho-CoA kinase